MSETLKPETHGLPWTCQRGDSDIAHESIKRGLDLCGSLEIDRNRWRSVAEQAEKALREISAQRSNRYESTAGVCANIADGALAAFDSLRKEGTGE